ncbi:MAG: DUF6340 family protein [Bacteroidota bacterium]|nr:DUF6340 family protein [Bacteroidota bacterium]MDP4205365.1 DUF6340 family protein [Bacteroidota bacterium]
MKRYMLFNSRIPGFLIILLIIGLQACKQYQTLPIEVLMPAQKVIPSNLQSFTIMNRSMDSTFVNVQTDSLQIYFLRNGFKAPVQVCDSMASDTLVKAFAELLFDSEFFDVVVPNNRNIFRTIPPTSIPDTLDWDFVSNVCSTYKTDGLIVLEKYAPTIKGTISSSKDYGNYSEPTEYYVDLDISLNALWRIYDPVNKAIIDEHLTKDTLFIEHSTYSRNDIADLIPSAKKSVLDASIWLAKDYAQRLSPVWVSDKRGVFLGNDAFNRAMAFVKNNEWDKAAEIWFPFTKYRNSAMRSKAEYNMAIAAEMNGNLKEAFEWATKSYKSFYRMQTENYLLTLKKRIEIVEDIEK